MLGSRSIIVFELGLVLERLCGDGHGVVAIDAPDARTRRARAEPIRVHGTSAYVCAKTRSGSPRPAATRRRHLLR